MNSVIASPDAGGAKQAFEVSTLPFKNPAAKKKQITSRTSLRCVRRQGRRAMTVHATTLRGCEATTKSLFKPPVIASLTKEGEATCSS